MCFEQVFWKSPDCWNALWYIVCTKSQGCKAKITIKDLYYGDKYSVMSEVFKTMFLASPDKASVDEQTVLELEIVRQTLVAVNKNEKERWMYCRGRTRRGGRRFCMRRFWWKQLTNYGAATFPISNNALVVTSGSMNCWSWLPRAVRNWTTRSQISRGNTVKVRRMYGRDAQHNQSQRLLQRISTWCTTDSWTIFLNFDRRWKKMISSTKRRDHLRFLKMI